jgi:hypothetical protein
MNWKGYGSKWSWSNLRYYHGIYLEGPRKTWKTFIRVAVFWAEIRIGDLPPTLQGAKGRFPGGTHSWGGSTTKPRNYWIKPRVPSDWEYFKEAQLFVVYLTTLFQYLRLYSVDFYSILICLPFSSEAGETRVRNMAEFCRRAPIVFVGFFYMP